MLALARGVWAGPCVLVAPAYGRCLETGCVSPDLAPDRVYAAIAALPDGVRRRVRIVHGVEDAVVDIAHSRQLAAAGLALTEVEGGDHSLNAFLLGRDGRTALLQREIERVA